MINIVLFAIVVAAVGGASVYIYRAKKDGQACIGCPSRIQCSSKTCSCCEKMDKLVSFDTKKGL